MSTRLSPPALRLVRLPGEFGPVVRCFGELSVTTAEILRRELARLKPMAHAVLTLNLSGCRFLDVEGMMTLLHASRQLREKGRRLVLVAGTPAISRLLQVTGLTRIVPMFATEAVAARALRGEAPLEPAPATWEAARAETVTRWRAIQELIEEAPEEALRQITSMFAICDRSEELFQTRSAYATARCQFCPLFYALGGGPEDVGCRSVLDPIIDLVRAGEKAAAEAQVAKLVRTIEEMPLPEEGAPPVPAVLFRHKARPANSFARQRRRRTAAA